MPTNQNKSNLNRGLKPLISESLLFRLLLIMNCKPAKDASEVPNTQYCIP